MMRSSWSLDLGTRLGWLCHGARTFWVGFRLCALDAAPLASPLRRRLHVLACLVLAPIAAPLVYVLEALASMLRRHAGVWW